MRLACTMQYLGRIDFRVEVRGFRIELGEMEAVMNAMRDELPEYMLPSLRDARRPDGGRP